MERGQLPQKHPLRHGPSQALQHSLLAARWTRLRGSLRQLRAALQAAPLCSACVSELHELPPRMPHSARRHPRAVQGERTGGNRSRYIASRWYPNCPRVCYTCWFSFSSGTLRHHRCRAAAAIAMPRHSVALVSRAQIVLLKQVDDTGFVFFTNKTSQKGRELLATRRAAFVIHWPELAAQVRVEGRIEEVASAASDAYFASRSRSSQLAAVASQQSSPDIPAGSYAARVEEATELHRGADVPRPAHWGGLRVVPDRIEFWRAQAHRQHTRDNYVLQSDGKWELQQLQP